MQDFVRGAPIWALGLVLSELFDLRVDPFYVFKNGLSKMHGGPVHEPPVQSVLYKQNRAVRDVKAEDSCFEKLQEAAFEQVHDSLARESLEEELKDEQQRVSGIFKDEKQKQYEIKHLVHACLTRGPVQRLCNFEKYIEQTRHLVGKAPSGSHVKERMPETITGENSPQVANVK